MVVVCGGLAVATEMISACGDDNSCASALDGEPLDRKAIHTGWLETEFEFMRDMFSEMGKEFESMRDVFSKIGKSLEQASTRLCAWNA